MVQFSYRAVDDEGRLVEGESEGSDRAALIDALARQGLRPIHVAPVRRGLGFGLTIGMAKPALEQDDLALMTRELATLLDAGLPLEQALFTVAQQEGGDRTARTCAALLKAVRGGRSFADALNEQGGCIPGYYVGLVRAGEAGGTLSAVMTDLADSLESARALRQDVRSALNYPIMVLATAGAAILILLLAVVPEFEPLFAGAGDRLPASAAAILGLSRALREWWWMLPALAFLLVFALRAAMADPALRAARDRRLLHLPVVGTLLGKIEAARFLRTMGTLLGNGVDAVPALRMSANTIANAELAGKVDAAAPKLRRGEGLTEPLAETGLLPPLALRLLQIGETSGRLAPMMLTVARIYEGEIARDTKKLVALIVPLVTLFLGIVVAGIIGAILSAILSSYDLPF